MINNEIKTKEFPSQMSIVAFIINHLSYPLTLQIKVPARQGVVPKKEYHLVPYVSYHH